MTSTFTIVKGFLFILANFLFIASLFHTTAKIASAISLATLNRPTVVNVNAEMWIASISFSYIMTYLFIW